MTKSHFRASILIFLGLGLIGGLADIVVPSLIAEPFHQAQQAHDAALSNERLFVSLALLLPATVAALVATYGLYRFRCWAPRLAAIGTVGVLLACPLLGTWAQSGVALSFGYAASYLWGGIITASYLQPYREWFAKQSDASKNAA